jgi:Na+/proline symporter
MLGGALICLIVVVMETEGGWSSVWHQAQYDGKLEWAYWGQDPTQAVLWVILVGNVLTRLSGLTSNQAVVQRYLTTKDTSSAVRALWLDVAVSIPWAIVVFGMGTALYVFYKNNPSMLSASAANDAIVPLFIAQQLPIGVAGLVVAAIFAAAMSSDGAIHSVATVYLTDFHNHFWPHSTERLRVLLARVVTAVLGCFGTGVAIYMAAAQIESLWDTFLAMVGAVSGVLSGLFILGMFTTRANGTGAVIGAVVGAVAIYAVERHTQISFFLYPLVGIGGCFVAGYAASLILPGQRRVAGLTVFTRANSAAS